MELSLKGMEITVSLEEMVEIINEREKHALSDPTMSDGKTENYLVVCMNDGVKIMAKYMRDYFANAFDNLQYETYKNGGEQ